VSADRAQKPGDTAAVTDPPAERKAATSARRTVRASELFAGARVLAIEHRGEIYCLRQTSRGKLILTK
jgi:hemin uptake protein HemP